MSADPKKKRSKLPSLKKLKTLIDKPFSRIIRARDAAITGGMCVFGCRRLIQCAFHFVKKSRSSKVRFDRRNVVGACFICNGKMEVQEGPFWTWYARCYGVDQMEALHADSRGSDPRSRIDLMLLLDDTTKESNALPPGSVPGEVR